MSKFRLIIICFILSLVCSFALGYSMAYGASTYYVKNGGSDAANGSSDILALATLSHVHATIGANDTVLLKRGSIFREELVNEVDGVTYSDYSTGDKPSIRGADLFNTAGSWTNESGNIWYLSSVSADPAILAHDGVIGLRKAAKVSLGAQWDYWWDDPNDRLYVYSVGNPTGVATNIEVATRDDCVNYIFNANITFNNIDFRYTRGSAFASIYMGTGCATTNCDFTGAGGQFLQFNDGGNGTVTGCTFTDWGILEGVGSYCVQAIAGDDGPSGPVDITGCTFTQTVPAYVDDHTCVMGDNGGWIRNFNNNIITGNAGKIHSSGFVTWQPPSTSTAITAFGNTISDIGAIGIEIQEIEFNAATPTVLIYNNRFNNTCLTDYADTESVRIWGHTTSSTVKVYYNIINGTYNGIYYHHGIHIQDQVGHSTELDIQNNSSTSNRGWGLHLDALCTITIWGHNNWYNNGSGNLDGKAAGAGDITTDPKFVDPVAGNFHLQADSPLINAGVDVGLTRDFEGNIVPR
jgi:hypothetical protein